MMTAVLSLWILVGLTLFCFISARRLPGLITQLRGENPHIPGAVFAAAYVLVTLACVLHWPFCEVRRALED